MKYLTKIIIGIIALLSFSLNATTSTSIDFDKLELINKKPVPKYEVDLVNKKINFIDVTGTYLIDNDHIDVVMQGSITTKNKIVDISSLKPGTYLLEIEHKGYIFTDEIIIK